MRGSGVEKRGRGWYIRWRVPARYRAVDLRPEINRSLGTDSYAEAIGRASLMKQALRLEWEAALAGEVAPASREAYESMVRLASTRGFDYKPAAAIATADIGEIMARIDAIADGRACPPESGGRRGGDGGARRVSCAGSRSAPPRPGKPGRWFA